MCWKTKFVWMAAAAWLTSCAVPEAERAAASLIEVDDLHRLLASDTPVALIDVRPAAEFVMGHVPGAINFWRTDLQRTDLPYEGVALPPAQFAAKLGAKGLTSAHRIVLYDDRGGVEAARVWWLLRKYGHTNALLLNGGLQAWGSHLTQDETKYSPAVFEFTQEEREDMDVDFETFEEWRQRPGVTLIDSRSEEEFSGKEIKNGAFMAGHVPGATHFCYSNCVDFGHSLALKDKEELKEMYAHLASPTDTVLVYCHSGVRSAYVWFVLHEVLEYPHVYNYDGSWIEWSFFHRDKPNEPELRPKPSLS